MLLQSGFRCPIRLGTTLASKFDSSLFNVEVEVAHCPDFCQLEDSKCYSSIGVGMRIEEKEEEDHEHGHEIVGGKWILACLLINAPGIFEVGAS